MLEELQRLVREHVAAQPGAQLTQLTVSGADCWTVDCSFELNHVEEWRLRNLAAGDVRLLKLFGESLGPVSKDHFCPYPWSDEAQLEHALENATRQALRRVDLSFLLLRNGLPAGYFFLWKGGGNAHSARHGVQVPELGVAIADAYQGRGLGTLAVRILVMMARRLGADAVELTTALSNAAGWNTYTKTGFEYTGIIRSPLEVDVTAAALGEVQASRYREERQMVHIIRPARRAEVLAYLATKRETAG